MSAKTRWSIGIVLILLAGVLVGVLLKGRATFGKGSTLVWILEPGPWPGLTPDERLGVVNLLLDHLELQNPGALMEGGPGQHPPLGATELRITGSKEGTDLVFKGSTRRLGKQRDFSLRAEPGEAMGQVLDLLGLPRKGTETLLPPSGAAAWTLVELMGLTSELDLDAKIQRAQALAEAYSLCPSVHLALAGSIRLGLNASSISNPDSQNRCRMIFERALTLLPHHPRGCNEFAFYLTDTGDQRAALILLFDALKTHPQSARLWGCLAYPARTGGLLAGAREALKARDRLQGHPQTEVRFADNVHLYSGDLDRYEASLGDGHKQPPNALLEFYRGYCRVLRGDLNGAKVRFQAAHAQSSTSLLFGKLAHIFLLKIDGRVPEAKAELKELMVQRRRLRVPDGEFTFKLAEAYAFLGEVSEAQTVAERAFDQGFACAEWYQASPLLAPIRTGPRWQALLQHVQERQRLLASRFPPERFKP